MSVPALQVTVEEACALVVGSWESPQVCEASRTPGAVCVARAFRRVGQGSGGNGIRGRSQPTDRHAAHSCRRHACALDSLDVRRRACVLSSESALIKRRPLRLLEHLNELGAGEDRLGLLEGLHLLHGVIYCNILYDTTI